jgi:hypothetical protein
MAQSRTCNLSVTGRPSSPLRHVFKVPPDIPARLAITQTTGCCQVKPSAVAAVRQLGGKDPNKIGNVTESFSWNGMSGYAQTATLTCTHQS